MTDPEAIRRYFDALYRHADHAMVLPFSVSEMSDVKSDANCASTRATFAGGPARPPPARFRLGTYGLSQL